MIKEQVNKFEIDPDELMDHLTEESPDTFLPNKIFDNPKVSGPIEKIVAPKEGGVDVYIKGLKYPMPGYPHRPMVKTACIIKRTSIILMEFFASMANRRGLIKLLILKKNIQVLVPKLIVLFSFVIGSRRLMERFYSPAPREIYRVFNLLIEREGDQPLKDRWSKIRDIVCLIIQFDAAYGYRLRDFLSELNMKKIKLTRRDLFFARQSNDYAFGGKKIRKK